MKFKFLTHILMEPIMSIILSCVTGEQLVNLTYKTTSYETSDVLKCTKGLMFSNYLQFKHIHSRWKHYNFSN